MDMTKMEEGKLVLKSDPLSLQALLMNVLHKHMPNTNFWASGSRGNFVVF